MTDTLIRAEHVSKKFCRSLMKLIRLRVRTHRLSLFYFPV